MRKRRGIIITTVYELILYGIDNDHVCTVGYRSIFHSAQVIIVYPS